MLATLEGHGVRYMVIGGLAAALHGSAHVTFDVDITPASDGDNLQSLSEALREMMLSATPVEHQTTLNANMSIDEPVSRPAAGRP